MSYEMKLPDACRYEAQNEHMIDGGYLPAGKLLIDAAAEIERLLTLLAVVTEIAKIAPEPGPARTPLMQALFGSLDKMEVDHRAEDMCICGHSRAVHIRPMVCGGIDGEGPCRCRRFQKRSEPGEWLPRPSPSG